MLVYTGEIINFNGIDFKVIDTSKIDFSNAKLGVKASLTKVVKAVGGEKIETKNKNGEVEAVYITKPGDAIFCNNEDDRYVPSDKDGNSWKFDNIESYGYVIVEKKDDFIMIRSNNKALLLTDFIKEPTCILNAFGKGQHQFLYKGATIKKDLKTEKITGIDKIAFENTWLIFEEENIECK